MFYSEMSWLANLSSTYDNYLDALDWLVTIYVQHGYDDTLLLYWKKKKLKEWWTNRLSQTDKETDTVLVLKSEFNIAWDFFPAAALEDTTLG